jgi:hypothetical protein
MPPLSHVPSGTKSTELKPTSYKASSSDRTVIPLSLLKAFSEGSWINLIIDGLTSIDERHLATLVSFVRLACIQ